MRKIKFRAWDVKVGAYVIPAHTMNIHTGQISDLPDRFLLEQFTGLHDKNGKEIYEGDIVRSPVLLSGEMINTIVRWIDCGFIANGLLGIRESENCEVLGNIHENPDLLEAVK